MSIVRMIIVVLSHSQLTRTPDFVWFCGDSVQGSFFATNPAFRMQNLPSKETQKCWKQRGTNIFLEEKQNFSVYSKKLLSI